MANGRTGVRKARDKAKAAENYRHPTSESLMRPEVGVQAQFKKRLPPKKYRYDGSLSPALEWDGQNPARERGEAHIAAAEAELSAAVQRYAVLAETLKVAKLSPSPIAEGAESVRRHVAAAQAAVRDLKAMSKPFLNWAGKAERLSFDVPTLPLFIHERLSTKAILDTIKGHKRDKQADMFDLFGDPQHSITDQVLRAYEHRDKWVNRMILGDSLVVMNSLLRYEGLGGQVQMIYIDPPYGVKFGSNFQPFVRKRDVSHNDDEDMTREPEMVQAYRDTWELGLHSYLTYLRDRLLMARELLCTTGSVFVQIGEENVHHVRELMDEVFGHEHFVSMISFNKNSGFGATLLPTANDLILWYARDIERVKFNPLFLGKAAGTDTAGRYNSVRLQDGTIRPATTEERQGHLPPGARLFTYSDLTKPGPGSRYEVTFNGKVFTPGSRWWGVPPEGMESLKAAGRLVETGKHLSYIRFLDDFPAFPLNNVWTDIGGIMSRSDPKIYVVQTSTAAITRCILMTTDPGDLVLDPTCGSGTTAYCAEQWGRPVDHCRLQPCTACPRSPAPTDGDLRLVRTQGRFTWASGRLRLQAQAE